MYYIKSSGKSELDKDKITNQLLCFGWIDSLPGKVDDEKTKIRISPRSPKSKWSKINKLKVGDLTRKDLMHISGMQAVNLAKKNGTWDALNEVEKLTLPNDFEKMLVKLKKTKKWDNLSRTTKRGFLESLLNTKNETKRKEKITSFIVGII